MTTTEETRARTILDEAITRAADRLAQSGTNRHGYVKLSPRDAAAHAVEAALPVLGDWYAESAATGVADLIDGLKERLGEAADDAQAGGHPEKAVAFRRALGMVDEALNQWRTK